MLVLSRRKNQKILLYDNKKLLIEVTVAAICGKRVKLGFTAPEEIIIDREEVYEDKKKGVDKKEGMDAREVARFQKSVEDLRHRH